MTEQSDDQQTHERLRSEATDLLLAASSPARNIPELKPLIDEHEGLVQRREERKNAITSITNSLNKNVQVSERHSIDAREQRNSPPSNTLAKPCLAISKHLCP